MIIVIAAVAVIVAFLIGFFISRRSGEKKMARAEELANKIIEEAEKSAAVKKKRYMDVCFILKFIISI